MAGHLGVSNNGVPQKGTHGRQLRRSRHTEVRRPEQPVEEGQEEPPGLLCRRGKKELHAIYGPRFTAYFIRQCAARRGNGLRWRGLVRLAIHEPGLSRRPGPALFRAPRRLRASADRRRPPQPENGSAHSAISNMRFQIKRSNWRSPIWRMGAVGFEPTKALANGFTARPLWPLGHTPKRLVLKLVPKPYLWYNLPRY